MAVFIACLFAVCLHIYISSPKRFSEYKDLTAENESRIAKLESDVAALRQAVVSYAILRINNETDTDDDRDAVSDWEKL